MHQSQATRQYEDEIRKFVFESFLFGQEDQELDDDESLLDSGVMDSTGVLELVAFLEQHFGVHVQDAELIPENLDSISRIAQLIQRKRSA